MKSTYKWGTVAFGISLVSTIVYGQARTPYTRPAYITTPGTVTAGSVVSNGNTSTQTLNVGTTSSGIRAHMLTEGNSASTYAPTVFDEKFAVFGRAATSGASSGGVFLTYHFGDNESVIGSLSPGTAWRPLRSVASNWKFQASGASLVASISNAGAFGGASYNSTTASGNQAFTCTNVGCRLSLGNTGRYLVDDGTSLEFVAPVETTSLTTTATGSGTKAMQIESGTVICLDGSACTRSLRGDGTESSLGAVRFYAGTIHQAIIDAVSSLRLRNTGITIADSGGAGAAAYTQSTYPSAVKYTCNDADGCDITMSEVGIIDGLTMRFTNESANTINFTDTAGVTELAGNFAMGQWDTLVLQYNTDRWVEVSRSNN